MNFLKGSLFRRNTEPEEPEPMEESGGGILAVWGSPGCGKTVTAVKIAKHLAAQKKNTVLLLCDMTAPMMPCICPPSELEVDKSLGSIFAAQHISVNLIKHNLTTLKRLPHLTMLGLRKKENEYTYAPCTKQQAEELIRGLREIVPYKDFSDAHIDTIEIMVSKLYAKWGITERSNFRRMRPEDYPILSDLYDLIEEEFKSYDPNAHLLYTEKLLQEVLLGLHSMCKGADAQFFNGHTNITSSRFLVFGVKGMLSAAKNVRNAMLFNVLSFMSDKLLTEGNTVAALDELYIWLSNPTAIEYIRNCLKRVRKKESAMLLASQNLEDFDQEGIREMTKPLFSIPPHQFLFNAGSIDKRSYMEMLQLDEAEYNLIKFPQRGVCLYKCGNERYLLEVHAPAYKEKLFGTAGGR